jgi:enoyl-CoA hydratase
MMSIEKNYTYKRVKVDIANAVATVYLYWPDGLRDPTTGGGGPDVSLFHDELSDALRQLRDDDTVRVVILRGAGDRYFLSTFAGVEDGDPALRGGSLDAAYNTARTATSMLEPILKMAKPVIAMVNGDALGIGASIAMACDLIIAAEDAFITDCHIASFYWLKRASVHQGTVPGDGGAVFWPLDMSLHLAKELLFTGRPITARELADMHVINRAVPKEQLQAAVDEMVQLLLDRPAWALGWTKVAMNKRLLQNFELTLDLGLAYELLATTRRTAADQRGITHI